MNISTSKKIGMMPGSLVYVGEKKGEKVKIQIVDYNEHQQVETEASEIEADPSFMGKDSVTWINVTGIHDTELIASLGSRFGLHPLVLEDVVNSEQRPKIDDYGDYLYVVLKIIYAEKLTHMIVHEQVSIIVSPNYLISFQEIDDDIFRPVRDRISHGRGKIRKRGVIISHMR